MILSRRHALGSLAAAGAATLIDPGPWLTRLAAEAACTAPDAAGTLLGTLPLFRNKPQPDPFGVKISGQGLDARLITDLSILEPGKLITPNALAYIRTEIPAAAAAHQGPWRIKTGGLIGQPGELKLDDLSPRAEKMGPHLFECSGNGNPTHFGLMSVAEFDGVPLTEVVKRLGPAPGATQVLVSGVDHDGQPSQRSVVGASWVFPIDAIGSMGAFLATRMNGEPLPPDHGAPVRLCIPAWYGCSWIKWVNEIRFVGPDEPATSQMLEFANRTHQIAQHPLARDYRPADIHTSAMPVRVEKRKTATGLEYRIVGIVWGGTRPVQRLAIRFGAEDPWKPIDICPAPTTHKMWSLWEYSWKPAAPGLYSINMTVIDPIVPQRRLDSGYYMRQVRIDEV